MANRSNEEIEALIAEGRRLVQEAKATLAKSERFFAEHNMTAAQSMQYLREQVGEEVVQVVQARVQATMDNIEQDIQRKRLHDPKTRATGQRVRVRKNLI
jgi:hypothetical protein